MTQGAVLSSSAHGSAAPPVREWEAPRWSRGLSPAPLRTQQASSHAVGPRDSPAVHLALKLVGVGTQVAWYRLWSTPRRTTCQMLLGDTLGCVALMAALCGTGAPRGLLR